MTGNMTNHKWASMEEVLDNYKAIHKDLKAELRKERKKKPLNVERIETIKGEMSVVNASIKDMINYLAPVRPVKYKNMSSNGKEIFHVDLPISVRIKPDPREIEEAYKLLHSSSLIDDNFKEKATKIFPRHDKNILQTEMVLENVTVEIITNPVTGETEIGWYKQPNTKDVTDSWYK